MIRIRKAEPDDGRCQACTEKAHRVIEASRNGSGVTVQLRLCGECLLLLIVRAQGEEA